MSERPKNPDDRAPPVLQRAPPAGARPGAAPPPGGRGLAAPEVTVSAAFAAGLPAEGTLAGQSPLRLYYLAAAVQAAGRLSIVSDVATYGLTFKKGQVEHASSSWSQDDLGEFLLRRGILPVDQVNDARALAPRLGGDMLAALVELRLIDPAARFQDLKEHGAGLVWRALATESGSWRWEPGAQPPAFGFPLGSRWGLLCDAVRRLDAAGVARRLGERAGQVATRLGSRVDIADLKLNPQEARAAGLFDGQRTVNAVAIAQSGDADVVRRVALLLAETELLSFGPSQAPEAPPEAPAPPAPAPPKPPPAAAPAPTPAAAPAPPARPPPRPAAPPPKPPPAKSPAPPASRPAAAPAAQTLESLRATLARFQESDHFQVLGVPREADLARIKAAYFQIAKVYHPDAAGDGEPEEARKLRAEVFARVGAAWAVLEDDKARAQYLDELRTGTSGQVDIAAILKAEQIFEKVPALVTARAYAEALQRVNEAMGLYAEEPEYGVWKAWIEFLLTGDAQKKGQRLSSERAIEAALKKVPKCGWAYLFLGRMAKLTGDLGAAEKHLKRGLAELPEHAELQREVRFLKK
ncbi:MAG TPA: J domain-containing protein [Anaeromyxobacteraceae bacterium]|nr:J domain-containing protein [Anaeromyxobacteraceae bacterium]